MENGKIEQTLKICTRKTKIKWWGGMRKKLNYTIQNYDLFASHRYTIVTIITDHCQSVRLNILILSYLLR